MLFFVLCILWGGLWSIWIWHSIVHIQSFIHFKIAKWIHLMLCAMLVYSILYLYHIDMAGGPIQKLNAFPIIVVIAQTVATISWYKFLYIMSKGISIVRTHSSPDEVLAEICNFKLSSLY